MKYLVLAFILLFSIGIAFAADPVFTGPTATTIEDIIIADRNYVAYNSQFYSGIASDGDGDLNEESCEVTIDAGASWLKHVDYPTLVDFNGEVCYSDLNLFESVATITPLDDLQVSFRISDDTFADALSEMRTWWLDNNAPYVNVAGATYPTYTNLLLDGDNRATNSGDGADFNQYQYMIDFNGVWVVSTDIDTDFNVMLDDFAVGGHTVTYWATDDLDNNTGLVNVAFNMDGASPTITGETYILVADPVRFYEGTDRNYYDIEFMLMSGVVTDADLDFNTASCEYDYNYVLGATNLWFPADWNADTNQCQVYLDAAPKTDDANYNFRVWDDELNDTEGVSLDVWYDETAPTTVGTEVSNYNYTTVILTSTDAATTTGSGSGVQDIWYSLDGADWTNTATNPASIEVRGGGEHIILFYGRDNLDNNEMAGDDVRTKPITVTGMSNQTCTLIPVLLLVLVASAIIIILGLFFTGNLDISTVVPIVVLMITFLIILYISGIFAGTICS